MSITPLVLLPLATLLLGVVLGFLLLRGKRKSVLIGIHLLLGLGTLEMAVIMLKGWPMGDAIPAGEYGNLAAGLLALAAFFGLLRPVVGRDSKLKSNAMLLVHGSVGLVGVLLCMAWLFQSP